MEVHVFILLVVLVQNVQLIVKNMKIINTIIIILQALFLEYYIISTLKYIMTDPQEWTNWFAKAYVIFLLVFLFFFVIWGAKMFIEMENE
jgi:uncharacterized membrane protein YdjX (TVP38/TMEM64 family)